MGIWILELRGVLICPGTNFLESCSITTVLKRALSREQNARGDDEEENNGIGKIENGSQDFGIWPFFHKKSGSNFPPSGPNTLLKIVKLDIYVVLFVSLEGSLINLATWIYCILVLFFLIF